MKFQHYPVMLNAVLHYLGPERDDSLFIDSTLGEGGHSAAILNSFERIFLVGLDADEQILKKARARLEHSSRRTQFFHTFFDDFFREYPLRNAPHRILFDLGISLFHYVESGRGFSFMRDESLDMRINIAEGYPLSNVLNGISEQELARILLEFGQERYAKRIAAAIVSSRKEAPLGSSMQLAKLVVASVPTVYRQGRIHAATRTFQALRIFINSELERLEVALYAAFARLEVGGRMAVISFHSLEDRIVKHVFKKLSKICICPSELPICECGRTPLAFLPLRRVLRASNEEVKQNPPSRSAKFRVIEKLRESR